MKLSPGSVHSAQVVVPQAHVVHHVPHVHGRLVEFLADVVEDGVDSRVRVVDADVQPAILLPLDPLKEALDFLILVKSNFSSENCEITTNFFGTSNHSIIL